MLFFFSTFCFFASGNPEVLTFCPNQRQSVQRQDKFNWQVMQKLAGLACILEDELGRRLVKLTGGKFPNPPKKLASLDSLHHLWPIKKTGQSSWQAVQELCFLKASKWCIVRAQLFWWCFELCVTSANFMALELVTSGMFIQVISLFAGTWLQRSLAQV